MRFLLFSILVFCGSYLTAQEHEEADNLSIEINFNDSLGIHYIHVVSKGNTLYSLSKLFQIPVSRIKHINELGTDDPIHIGDTLSIPFDPQLLYTGVSIQEFDDADFIPVFYTIKPLETVYRVSKVYFKQDPSILLNRNNLTTSNLGVNQKLLIGWIPIDETVLTLKSISTQETIVQEGAIKDSTNELSDTSNQTLLRDSLTFDTIDHRVIAEPEIRIEEIGLAYWNRHGSDKTNLFALHPKAKINSLIEIFNPQLQRRTYAKVIGRIPDVYPENIDIIVSPKVASVLGGLNTEFRVRLNYYQ